MSFVAPRNVTSTVFLEDMAMPDDFRSVYVMSLVLSSLGTVHGAICTRIVWRAYSKAVRNVSRSIARQTLRDLLGLMISSMLMNGANFALSAIPYSWRACAFLGGVPACTYVFTRCFYYRVLLARAESVESVMPSWYLFLLEYPLRFGANAILLVAVPASISFSGKLLFQEGVCTQQVNGLFILVCSFVDSLFSATMLIIFLVPLLRQSRSYLKPGTSEGKESLTRVDASAAARLRRAAVHAFALSSFSILSSFVFLSLHAPMYDEEALEKVENQHFRLYTVYASSIDSTINSIALLLLYRKLVFGKKSRRVSHAGKGAAQRTRASMATRDDERSDVEQSATTGVSESLGAISEGTPSHGARVESSS